MDYIIKLIREKLAIGLGKRIQYYYIGDPQYMPSEVLEKGCILLIPEDQETTLKETQRDEDTYNISIVVLKDMRPDFKRKPQEVLTTQWVMDIADGRNDDGTLKTNTVRYIMRKALTEIGVSHDMTFEYATTQREEVIARAVIIKLRVVDFVNRAR